VRASRRLILLTVGDGPEPWQAAGFRVSTDPPEGTHGTASLEVGSVRVQLVGDRGARGLLGWGFEPARTAPIDGLPVAAPTTSGASGGIWTGVGGVTSGPAASAGETEAVEAAVAGATQHANGATTLDHVVVTSPDVGRTTAALAAAGIQPRRTVQGARGDAELLYRFFLLGTCVLELVGPVSPAGDGPARFAGLAFTTTAIDGLGGLAGRPRPAMQPGRRIATLRREVGISTPVAFLTPRS
jgi:hypothetical protein